MSARRRKPYDHPHFSLVTGGSRGIGAECAVQLATISDKVAITYFGSEEAAREVAEKIRENGAEPILVRTDLRNPDAWGVQLEELMEEHGPIDFLLNNAGVSFDNICIQASYEELVHTFTVNVFAMWMTMTKVASAMMLERRGRIVNMASVASEINSPGKSIYAASKAAIASFTRSFAKELGRLNIRVNAVAPGFVNTDLIKDIPEKIKETYEKEIPLGRFGEPADVAGLVLFLASEAAEYVHGSIFVVDGGMLA